jgi:hypothetical protein
MDLPNVPFSNSLASLLDEDLLYLILFVKLLIYVGVNLCLSPEGNNLV